MEQKQIAKEDDSSLTEINKTLAKMENRKVATQDFSFIPSQIINKKFS